MRNKWIRIASLGLVVVLMLALVGVAQAQTTLTGVVTAKNADTVSVPPVYTLTVDVTEADDSITTYSVSVDQTTYDAVSIGDIIEFTGTETDDSLTDAVEFDATGEGAINVIGSQVTGTVVSCSDITGIIVIDVAGEEVSLRLPEGTTCADYPEVGEEATVGGEEDVQEVKNDFDGTRGYYCTDAESTHPMVSRLAERYGVDEAKIRGWFCSGFGFGEIMLALQTASTTGLTPDEYLAQRGSGLGWGQIWKMDGLVASEGDALPPGQAKKNNPDMAPGNSGNAPGHNQSDEENTNTDNDCPGNSCNAPGHSGSDDQGDSPGNSGNHDNNQSQGNSGDHGNSGNALGHNK